MLRPLALIFTAAAVGLSAPVIGVLPGDTQVDISWKAPTSPVDFVVVEESRNGGADWKQIAMLPGSATHHLVDDLTNGTNYWFRVKWMSKGIPSSPSQAVVAQPNGQPEVPTSLIAIAGDGQASLQWDAAPASAKIVSYAVEISADGGTTWKLTNKDTGSPSNRYLIDGLENGLTYSFRVKAIASNRIDSEWSDSAAALIGVLKDDFFELDSTITGSSVALTWGDPGLKSTIDSYRIEISTDGGMTWSNAEVVDGNVQSLKLSYVLGGALYRIIATSVTDEYAVSVISLVQNLEDAKDSPITQVDANAGQMQNDETTANSGNENNEANQEPQIPGATTTDKNGGVGTRESLPKFDPASFPEGIVNTSVAALALLGILSGAARIKGFRRDDELAALNGVSYSNPESFDDFDAQGDRSKSWRRPSLRLTQFVEKLTHAIAANLNRFSPLLGRIYSDGTYLRAMYGANAILTWVGAVIFAVIALLETGGQALPPKPLTVMALLLLGILDLGAAGLAVTIVLAGTTILGGLDSAPAIRTSLGLAILWLAPALIASAARPIRRKKPEADGDNQEELSRYQWERAGDLLIGPLLAAFAVKSLIFGLPTLAGLSLPIVNSANLIAILAFFFVALRYSLEESATKNYPVRLLMVERNQMHNPLKVQRFFSIALTTFLFVFLAQPFIGNSWQLYVSTFLLIFPAFLSTFAKSFPKSSLLSKLVPVGVARLVLLLTIGAICGLWVSGSADGAERASIIFVLLSIPGFIFSIAALFTQAPGPESVSWYEGNRAKWFYRIGAIALVLIGTYLALN
jgi:hypothetical protein